MASRSTEEATTPRVAIHLREGADRPRDGAGCDLGAGGRQARARPGELGMGERELEPERRGLGMDAVRAADGRRELVLEGAALERGQERLGVGDQQIARALELHVEAGVEHVGRCHALVHEARLGADDLGQMRQERDHIVLDLALDRIDAGNVELGVAAALADGLGGRLRDHPELGHGIGGMRLDLEPDAIARLRVPDRRHVGPGIARDHAASPRASAAALRIAAMFFR